MSASTKQLYTKLPALICRGCLKERGEMKNMYEAGLDVDFFSLTEIPRMPSDGLPVLLCAACEADLKSTKRFKERCQQSDKILKITLTKKKPKGRHPKPKAEHYEVKSILTANEVTLLITAPNPNEKILLKCPYTNCKGEFRKNVILASHLKKTHGFTDDLQIKLQYYCTEAGCTYNEDSKTEKFFTGRKFLNQHVNKMHKDKVFECGSCYAKFAKDSDYHRHLKTCHLKYFCTLCKSTHSSHERYLVHLSRRHPDIHAQYKEERKTKKRLASRPDNMDVVPAKITAIAAINATATTDHNGQDVPTRAVDNEDETKEPAEIQVASPWNLDVDVFETTIPMELNEKPDDSGDDDASLTEETGQESFGKVISDGVESEKSFGAEKLTDFEKKSSGTQIPEHVRNDVTLSPWTKIDFEMQTDAISTQTVFGELLRPQPEDIFFSESVSLSDIQTQTMPLEFGLTQNNKGTQSNFPGLSFKETQTNFESDDSERNFRFDSRPSSPSGVISNAQTQTTEARVTFRSDVLLSFSSAETQTNRDDYDNSDI